MSALVGVILAMLVIWGMGRWARRREPREALGNMSQRWMTEQRLSQQPDPQR